MKKTLTRDKCKIIPEKNMAIPPRILRAIKRVTYTYRGVAPVGSHYGHQLIQITKHKNKISEQYFTPCVFVPLIGKHGWQE